MTKPPEHCCRMPLTFWGKRSRMPAQLWRRPPTRTLKRFGLAMAEGAAIFAKARSTPNRQRSRRPQSKSRQIFSHRRLASCSATYNLLGCSAAEDERKQGHRTGKEGREHRVLKTYYQRLVTGLKPYEGCLKATGWQQKPPSK